MKILFKILVILILPLTIALAGSDEPTNDSDDLEKRLKQLEAKMLEMQRQHAEQMSVLTNEIKSLQSELKKSKTVAATPANAPKPQELGYEDLATRNTYFNPKISVITDMVGIYAEQDGENEDHLLIREVEIGFSGHVDTWGRYDLTTTIHNHPELTLGSHSHDLGHAHETEEAHEHGGGLEVEEGYFTFLTLPAGLKARVGKYRLSVGKTNALHPHSIPWTEYPLAIRSYLGEEGIIGTGLSLSWLAPWDLYTELTYEVFKTNPEHESGVAAEEADGYSHLAGATVFFDLSDNLSLELGGTSLVTPASTMDWDDNWLNSIDATLKWSPFGDGSYRTFEWRTEVFGLRKTLAAEHEGEDDHHDDHDDHGDHDDHAEEDDDHHDEDHDHEHADELERESLFGFYSSLSYRMNRWWELGGRYDYAEGPFDIHQETKEYSLFLTWWQSEYAYWRLNFIRHEMTLDDLDLEPVNKLYLQFNFSLGPHPAHKY
jgi:hypothetical protein